MNRNQELVNILLSVAVADAIGADVEFMANPTKRDFLAQVNGVHPLRVTDDTQMSLFTAEALLKGYKSREFQRAYLQWYQTQMANSPVVSPPRRGIAVGGSSILALRPVDVVPTVSAAKLLRSLTFERRMRRNR